MAIIKVITPSVTDANITTAKVTDNAITLAKMASGTDGNIISYDASGNPVAIATGNDGQVLTSTGAGSPPAFENSSGGANTPAFQATLSSDAQVNQGTWTVVPCNTEAFDVGSGYNNSTYKFQPQTSGKYFCYSVVHLGIANNRQFLMNTAFYKNGALSNGALYSQYSQKDSFDYATIINHDVISFNGSSDYIKLMVYNNDYTGSANYNLRGDASDGRRFNMFGAYKIIE